MIQSFDSNKHYEIMQAILIHVRKYNLDVRKTVIFLSHVLKGEFDYVTNDENARITLKKYGSEEIRKVIFENLIISEGVLLHNMEKANKPRQEKGMSDEKRKLRYAYDIQNPEFQRTHNLDSYRVEDALERGLVFQCGNVGKNENPLYDWYLIEFASNVVSSRVELLLTGQVKLGWYHPSQIISFPSITRLLNSLNSAYYKRIQSKSNPEVEEAVTVDSSELPSNDLGRREQMQKIAQAIGQIVIEKTEQEKQQEASRNDYESEKQEYEEIIASKELVNSGSSKSTEEIDSDLDEFEVEERRILNSKHFTDAQKKQMIEELYSEFDKYTEENPELSGRQR